MQEEEQADGTAGKATHEFPSDFDDDSDDLDDLDKVSTAINENYMER